MNKIFQYCVLTVFYLAFVGLVPYGMAHADIIYDNGTPNQTGIQNSSILSIITQNAVPFVLSSGANTISGINWWGGCEGIPLSPDSPVFCGPVNFELFFYSDNAGSPGSLIATYNVGDATQTATGKIGIATNIITPFPFYTEYSYSATIDDLSLTAGSQYWLGIRANVLSATVPEGDTWGWAINNNASPTGQDFYYLYAPFVGIDGWQDTGVTSSYLPFNLVGSNTATLGQSAAELAKSVVGGDYELGAKGWDWIRSIFVDPDDIRSLEYAWDWADVGNIDNVLDCSGLVLWSYNRASGATNYRQGNPVYYESADGQYRNNTTPITEDQLLPGDLLFFNFDAQPDIDHVAMYVGPFGLDDKDVVQASSPSLGIISSSMSSLSGIVGYGRISTPKKDMVIKTHSPIGLIVTDPDGNTITPQTTTVTPREILHEVPGALYYFVDKLDDLGRPDVEVAVPTIKQGNYSIIVVPNPGVAQSDTYGLDVETSAGTITLAQDTAIRDIPVQGYGVHYSGSSPVSTFIPITVKVKPRSAHSMINISSKATVPIAILSNTTFDAPSKIDTASLTFGRNGNETSLKFCDYKPIDINHDGYADLMCHFKTNKFGFRFGDTKGVLKGKTNDGEDILGTAIVHIVNP